MTYKTKHSTGVNRLANWPERLAEFLSSNSDTPFEWGSFDCSQFCIQAEQAIYGETRWPDLVGGYKTERGALGRIKRAGGESLWDLIDSRMQRLESVKMAQRGDWIGHYTEYGESLGILVDSRFACVDIESGLNLLPITEAVVAWRS